MICGLIFWASVGFMFYVYLGYPFLIVALSRLRPRERYSPFGYPIVSLIIAAYNEKDVISDKLEQTLALEYPPERLQIIVAADGSTDRTPELVNQFKGRGVVLSYSPERRGKMAAINRAVLKARGEIIVLSDANNMYSKGTLKELVKPFSDRNVGAVSGAKSILNSENNTGESEGLYWKYESMIKIAESRFNTCTAASAEILAVRRDLYVSPPDTIINDDFYLICQILLSGHKVVYAPDARSMEPASPEARDELTRRSRIVAGRYQAMSRAFSILPYARPTAIWQILSHKFSRPLVPFAMIAAFLAPLGAVLIRVTGEPSILYLSDPFGPALLFIQVLFYLVAIVGPYAARLKRLRILYLTTFLVSSNFAALLGLYMFMTQKHPHLWKRVARTGLSRGSTEK